MFLFRNAVFLSLSLSFAYITFMLVLQNSFLELPLQNAVALYHDHVVPRLTRKNKSVAISVAIVLSLIAFIREKILKPPKNIRHIPYISVIKSIKATLRDESIWNRAYKLYLPAIHTPGNKGVIAVSTSRL